MPSEIWLNISIEYGHFVTTYSEAAGSKFSITYLKVMRCRAELRSGLLVAM